MPFAKPAAYLVAGLADLPRGGHASIDWMSGIITMWPVFALLLTPCISLLDLSMAYTLFSPFCEPQSAAWLHGFYGVSLAINATLTFHAWPGRSPAKPQAPSHYGDPAFWRSFTESVAGATGLLFTMATAAQWLAVWLLSPCLA